MTSSPLTPFQKMSSALELPPETVMKVMLAVPEEQQIRIRRLYAREPRPLPFKHPRSFRKIQPDEVEEVVLRHEIAAIVREELKKLNRKELCALQGWLIEGIPLKQIAKDLGMTPQGVAYHVNRGIKKLRKNPRLASLCEQCH